MAWLDDVTLSTVIVHTTHGASFKGLKQAVHEDCLVLRDAMLLEDAGPQAPQVLKGLIVIPREHVDFMQLIEAS